MNRKLTTKTDLAKRAKDFGSAAVLVSIVFAIFLSYTVLPRFLKKTDRI